MIKGKKMNHVEYQRSLKCKPDCSLRYIIEDCHKSLESMPDSPNADYYADEINYCAMELKARRLQLVVNNTRSNTI
jgi:hypothetical protein